MTTTVFVLLMLFGTADVRGGHASIQQEFTSKENCMLAGKAMAQGHNSTSTVLKAWGCFQK